MLAQLQQLLAKKPIAGTRVDLSATEEAVSP